jgi:Osmosensitive K+ channel His kinase sensor domain
VFEESRSPEKRGRAERGLAAGFQGTPTVATIPASSASEKSRAKRSRCPASPVRRICVRAALGHHLARPGIGSQKAVPGKSTIFFGAAPGVGKTYAMLEAARATLEELEFDLDLALRRKPALVLVDRLAHTNAKGARHAKRQQDVQKRHRRG